MGFILAATPAGITIDVALTFVGFFVGCIAALVYSRLAVAAPPAKPAAPLELPAESIVNDAARANMAAQQLRDLAHNVASDVGAHNELFEGIADQLGAL